LKSAGTGGGPAGETDAPFDGPLVPAPFTAKTVNTDKGAFVIEFLPVDAPLTVDNFVTLARRGYFNGQTVPRVVPNFVIQTGDPRGDPRRRLAPRRIGFARGIAQLHKLLAGTTSRPAGKECP